MRTFTVSTCIIKYNHKFTVIALDKAVNNIDLMILVHGLDMFRSLFLLHYFDYFYLIMVLFQNLSNDKIY